MPKRHAAKGAQTNAPPCVFPEISSRSTQKYKDAYSIETLMDGQIHLVNTCLTPANCNRLRKFFNDTITPMLAPPVAPRKGEALRTNERFSCYDPKFAASLFVATQLDACASELGLDRDVHGGTRTLKGLNPNIRIYRYTQGTAFGPHYDDAVTDPKSGWTSAWTLLIYLTEGDLIGGETAFHVSKDDVLAPRVVDGRALLHKHGADCLLHEGKLVKQGIKWVLRSDLMYA